MGVRVRLRVRVRVRKRKRVRVGIRVGVRLRVGVRGRGARLCLRRGGAAEQHDGGHDEAVDGVHVVPEG